MSVDTTAATRLSQITSDADVSWYRIDLEDGNYVYDALLRGVGDDETLIHNVDSIERFGEWSTRDNFISSRTSASASRDQATISRPAAGRLS